MQLVELNVRACRLKCIASLRACYLGRLKKGFSLAVKALCLSLCLTAVHICLAQAWFPGNYANISSAFQELTALDYYIFQITNLPAVAFSSSQLPAFIATDVRVRPCEKQHF